MTKKYAVRFVSFLTVFCMIFTLFGCKKSNDSETSHSELEHPSFENNTAVVPFTSTDESGNEIIASTVISKQGEGDKINEIATGLKVSEMAKTDDQKQEFIKNSQKDYDITEEKAKEIIDNSDLWVQFDYTFFVANTTGKRIYVKGVQAENNDGLIVQREMDCEYSFKPGNGMTMIFYGLVNLGKYKNDQELIEALKGMNVSIVYTLIGLDEFDVEDWDKAEIKTLPITIE